MVLDSSLKIKSASINVCAKLLNPGWMRMVIIGLQKAGLENCTRPLIFTMEVRKGRVEIAIR